ncbi:MAG: HD domain-containing protein [Bacteroides sp.]|nr:HD domain-containing protein [Bacteroides sp.]MCM1548391.1 HD domain-containing protein [Clostridium sp.]
MKRTGSIVGVIVLILTFYVMQPGVIFAESRSGLQDWIIYEYNETNGLPTGEANTVLQTRDGYVWIGSYGGLIRYDGTTFRNYSNEKQILSSSIRCLFEDSKERLWIGTNDRGVYLYADNCFTHYGYADEKEFLSVRSFAEDQNGNIYVGTTSGLARIEGNEMVLVNEEVYGTTVYSMAVDENNVLWTCMNDGIAKLLFDGTVIYTFDSEEFLEAPLYFASQTKDYALYLGTSGNQIYQVSFRDTEYQKESFLLQEYSIEALSTVNDIRQDAEGNIWVAALNGTGYLTPNGQWHEVIGKHVTAVNTVSFDYEGNVWLASTSYGVLHLVDGIFYNGNEAAGLSETSINTVAVCGNEYYLGTDTGLIVRDQNLMPVENELTQMLDGIRIRNILCDRDGNIWIGTYYQYGLLLYEPEEDRITEFNKENGMADEQIRMILECSDGRIAVATQGGISILENHAVVQSYTEENGLTYPIILCLCEGTDGTLYAGSDGQGFYAIREGTITHYGFDEGLSSGVVLRMLPDEEGKGLFISAGNELFYWDFEEFRLIQNYEKSAGSIFDLYLNGEELWLMQSNGIHILNREKLLSGAETEVRLIGVSDGLTGTLNANTWNTEKNGMYYLCTSNGLSILKLEELEQEPREFLAVISQVEVDDQIYEAPEQVELDGEVTRLTFQFAVLSYTEKEITVQYQLKGFDEEPYTLTNSQPLSVSYTNLSGGDYEFVLEVLNTEGEVTGIPYTVKLHKEYMLWEHTWFWVVIGIAGLILVAVLVWLGVLINTIRLKRRQAAYQSIIEQALKTFANTIDAKDAYTNGHSIRVAAYSLEIAKKLKLSKEEQERIYYIALLHDIGKIGISDKILNKPGKLTPEEREIIKSHPSIGGDILKDFSSLPGISDGARYHHERYDGTGYNEGLKGEEIPFFARIICVADSYDAMSSARCYRKDMDRDRIIEELKSNAGTQFDPNIVEIMLELMEEGTVPIHLEDRNSGL